MFGSLVTKSMRKPGITSVASCDSCGVFGGTRSSLISEPGSGSPGFGVAFLGDLSAPSAAMQTAINTTNADSDFRFRMRVLRYLLFYFKRWPRLLTQITNRDRLPAID